VTAGPDIAPASQTVNTVALQPPLGTLQRSSEATLSPVGGQDASKDDTDSRGKSQDELWRSICEYEASGNAPPPESYSNIAEDFDLDLEETHQPTGSDETSSAPLVTTNLFTVNPASFLDAPPSSDPVPPPVPTPVPAPSRTSLFEGREFIVSYFDDHFEDVSALTDSRVVAIFQDKGIVSCPALF
jgi:hypothetical protein